MKKLLLLFPFLYCTMLEAQTCQEIWLQGQYVEVGISACGSYGTDAAPPPGFHPNSGLPGLGYVVDFGKDGWTTGTPSYCGDYFVPGTPVEGWALTADGVDYLNSNGPGPNICVSPDIPCTSTMILLGTAEDTAIWVGQTATGLQVTQYTMVPDTDLYFLTQVCIKNLSADTVHGIYYARNVDPDNDQPWSGSFITTNQILAQPIPGGSSMALVTATGVSYGCYFGMGAMDSTAIVGVGGFLTLPADSIYHSIGGIPRETSVGYFLTSDMAVSMAWNLGSLIPSDQVCIAFANVLDSADLGAAMMRTGHWGPDSVLTGVNAAEVNSFQIIMNSAAHQIQIEMPQGTDFRGTSLEILNVNGSLVRQSQIHSNPFTLSTDGLAPGMYFARVTRGFETLSSSKIWIQ